MAAIAVGQFSWRLSVERFGSAWSVGHSYGVSLSEGKQKQKQIFITKWISKLIYNV